MASSVTGAASAAPPGPGAYDLFVDRSLAGCIDHWTKSDGAYATLVR